MEIRRSPQRRGEGLDSILKWLRDSHPRIVSSPCVSVGANSDSLFTKNERS